MTQEEKDLLLKDLCSRLPYETWVKYEGKEWLVTGYGHGRVSLLPSIFSSIGGPCPLVEEVSPYLRSMSSMTAEEEYEYHQCKNIDYLEICEMEHTKMLETTALCFSRATDWLNKNGFDYRGLIPMGLALEAPKDMYKNE